MLYYIDGKQVNSIQARAMHPLTCYSSNSCRTAHMLRAPDIDPLDDDIDAHLMGWDDDEDLQPQRLCRPASARELRQVRKAFEAAERSGRMWNGI